MSKHSNDVPLDAYLPIRPGDLVTISKAFVANDRVMKRSPIGLCVSYKQLFKNALTHFDLVTVLCEDGTIAQLAYFNVKPFADV